MKLKGERVASDVIKELSNILLTEVKDDDLKKVTITYYFLIIVFKNLTIKVP